MSDRRPFISNEEIRTPKRGSGIFDDELDLISCLGQGKERRLSDERFCLESP